MHGNLGRLGNRGTLSAAQTKFDRHVMRIRPKIACIRRTHMAFGDVEATQGTLKKTCVPPFEGSTETRP